MKLSQIVAKPLPASMYDCEVSGLTQDSRKVEPGYLFLAFRGNQVDGRNYIQQAILAGAAGVIYDPEDMPELAQLPDHIPCIPLAHLSAHLAALACSFYNYPAQDLNITGVTGTNGKTTIAYQLTQAHQLLGQKSAYIGTLGEGLIGHFNLLANTTPDALCLQRLFRDYLNADVNRVCMEVSSHALSLHRVEGIPFKHAIFTNLTHDHLDFHQNMEAYAAAKAELFALPGVEYAIINGDDPYSAYMKKAAHKDARILTYGMSADCDVRAINWSVDLKGTRVTFDSPWGQLSMYLKALGMFNLYNGLAVVTSLLASGYERQACLDVMAQLLPSPGRMEIVAQAPYILVDYAHTPDALEKVLKTLNEVKQGKLLVVFGCGGDRDTSKRAEMGKVATQLADISIITSDNPRHEAPEAIIEDIISGVMLGAQVLKEVDRKKAIAMAMELCSPDDILVIAGKGHEAYQQIGDVKHNFSDQEVVKGFLSLPA